MTINLEKLRSEARIASVTVSATVTGPHNKKDQAFVCLTVKGPEEGWTREEAHIVHKLTSMDATEMAYMDALARGIKDKGYVNRELTKRKRNYDLLIKGLERKFNKTESVDATEAAA